LGHDLSKKNRKQNEEPVAIRLLAKQLASTCYFKKDIRDFCSVKFKVTVFFKMEGCHALADCKAHLDIERL
jgi:hypothetical protein